MLLLKNVKFIRNVTYKQRQGPALFFYATGQWLCKMSLVKEVRASVDLSKSCVFFTQYASAYLHVSKYLRFIWGNRAKFHKKGAHSKV